MGGRDGRKTRRKYEEMRANKIKSEEDERMNQGKKK